MPAGAKSLPNCGSELARDIRHYERGYSSLRTGRWSASHATYFVTFCTRRRKGSLASTLVLSALERERAAMDADESWRVRAWVVMPDHLHVLFDLGDRLTLGRCMARFKAKTAPLLRVGSLFWQPGYYEHRLRSIDELRPTLYYLLMNPVRAGVAARGEEWPGFYCGAEDWEWFHNFAAEAVPEPEWLCKVVSRASSLPQH